MNKITFQFWWWSFRCPARKISPIIPWFPDGKESIPNPGSYRECEAPVWPAWWDEQQPRLHSRLRSSWFRRHRLSRLPWVRGRTPIDSGDDDWVCRSRFASCCEGWWGSFCGVCLQDWPNLLWRSRVRCRLFPKPRQRRCPPPGPGYGGPIRLLIWCLFLRVFLKSNKK